MNGLVIVSQSLQPIPLFDRNRYPTEEDLATAAFIWSLMAIQRKVRYAYIGGFAALLMGREEPPDCIDILVDSDMNTVFQELTRNPDYSPYFAITANGTPVVLNFAAGRIHHHRGVALRFFAVGTSYFPRWLVGPYHPYDPPRQYGSLGILEPTWNLLELRTPNGLRTSVPVVRARMLLTQTLLTFSSMNAREKRQAFFDINTFLTSAINVPPNSFFIRFSVGDVARLKNIVVEMFEYAESMLFISTTRDDLEKWRVLGLDVREEHIPKRWANNNGGSGLGGLN